VFSQSLTIGAFAAAAGVSVETVRYYQRERLLNVIRSRVIARMA